MTLELKPIVKIVKTHYIQGQGIQAKTNNYNSSQTRDLGHANRALKAVNCNPHSQGS